MKLQAVFFSTLLAGTVVGCSGDESSTTTTTTMTTTGPSTGGSSTGGSSTGGSSTGGSSTGGSSTGGSSTGGSSTGGSSTGGSSTGGGMGDYYGDPSAGNCLPDETPISIDGIEGAFCSPGCDGAMAMCPPPPDGVTGMALCALGPDPMTPMQCAIICELGDPSGCPTGASCKDIMMNNLGVCTYP